MFGYLIFHVNIIFNLSVFTQNTQTQLDFESSVIFGHLTLKQSLLVGSVIKNTPAKQEVQIWSLSQEDPLEKEMATHSSFLAWEISWTEEPGWLYSMRSQKSRTQLSN